MGSGFDGQHVVVTGGSSGIGLATARSFGLEGAAVSLVARGSERLEAAALEMKSEGLDVGWVSADVSDFSSLAEAMDSVRTDRGPCDVLVTSAGIAHPGHFTEIEADVFRTEMEVNYFGTLNAIRLVAAEMIERRRGRIVGISSAAGIVGIFGYTAYTPTKFAVRGLLESLRAEMIQHDVHVHCVFPADIDTPQLTYENQIKPAETAAISGTIKPLAASAVADAIIEGIQRNRFAIYSDFQTRLVGPVSALAGRSLRRNLDKRAAKANRT